MASHPALRTFPLAARFRQWCVPRPFLKQYSESALQLHGASKHRTCAMPKRKSPRIEIGHWYPPRIFCCQRPRGVAHNCIVLNLTAVAISKYQGSCRRVGLCRSSEVVVSRCALLNSFCTSILAVCVGNPAFVLKGREQRESRSVAASFRLLPSSPSKQGASAASQG
jgi:hypothetical protein